MTSLASATLSEDAVPVLSPFELELANHLVSVLNLDIQAGDVDPTTPLFHDGLGLDSIDMLEIALTVSQHYGCSLRSDDPDNTRIFSSLRALAQHVASRRTR